jgi:phage baseplate assembly protein W
MSGYSARLPFQKDPNDGFALLKTLSQVASQNIKMVMFTEPGERVFDRDFGVGIRKYLFEQNSQLIREQLQSRIRQQIRKYLPYVNVVDISFSSRRNDGTFTTMEQESNRLSVRITYQISNFLELQTLEI